MVIFDYRKEKGMILDLYHIIKKVAGLENDGVVIFDEEAELDKYKKNESNNEFLNKYGFASAFMLIGSLLICLGVMITILMYMWGM